MVRLTERQAIICERALDMLAMGLWNDFESDIEQYTEEQMTDEEIDRLLSILRGE